MKVSSRTLLESISSAAPPPLASIAVGSIVGLYLMTCFAPAAAEDPAPPAGALPAVPEAAVQHLRMNGWSREDAALTWVVVVKFPLAKDPANEERLKQSFKTSKKQIEGRPAEDTMSIVSRNLGNGKTTMHIAVGRFEVDAQKKELLFKCFFATDGDKKAVFHFPLDKLVGKERAFHAYFTTDEALELGNWGKGARAGFDIIAER